MTAGYSRTPLAKKLSLKDGLRVWWDGMPQSVAAEIEDSGVAIDRFAQPQPLLDAAHIFVRDREQLASKLSQLLPLLDPAGFIWVSWPKRASQVPTDISEDTIRDIALPMGLVDVKVCAIDSIWSGLKLVIRKELRRG